MSVLASLMIVQKCGTAAGPSPEAVRVPPYLVPALKDPLSQKKRPKRNLTPPDAPNTSAKNGFSSVALWQIGGNAAFLFDKNPFPPSIPR